MTTMESKIPTEDRPMRVDPDLAASLEKLLEPYEGEKLEAAQAAVQTVRASSVSGVFGKILDAYREAVEAAVAG